MPYNKVNKLRRYREIAEETSRHAVPGVTSYRWLWERHIYPKYHISYSQYMEIVNTPDLEGLLEAEERRCGRWEDPMQTKMVLD